MANYIVSDTNLTAVANAIRQKGGTSASLEFPDDFVEAIGDIGGGSDTLAALEANTLTSWTSTATEVQPYLFYRKSSLTSASYPNATNVGTYAFQNCGLTSVNFPNVTSTGANAFYGCTELTSVVMPKCATLGASAFQNCSKLALADIKAGTNVTNAFYGCTVLSTLILRNTSVASLKNTNVFYGTPFGNGSGGTLYVPQDLITSYQSASNWSTILGYPNNQIKAIEGSIYE